MGKVKENKVKPPTRRASVTENVVRRGAATTSGKPRRMSPAAPAQRAKGSAQGHAPANRRRAAGSKTPEAAPHRGRGRPKEERREVKVRELVPEKICGPRTRVHQVFRVEERVNGSSQTHLVFNDRHGWYCEHGTDCHAVGAVRKSGKSEAARRLAWTTNGRMRE